MPTYQYECRNCGHEFEAFQSMKDAKFTKCPQCGQDTLQRLVGTGGGLIFKGSGFYLTDYVKKEGGESKKTTASTDTGKKEETKSTPADTPAVKKESNPASNNSGSSKD